MSTSVLISSQQASPLQGEGWESFFSHSRYACATFLLLLFFELFSCFSSQDENSVLACHGCARRRRVLSVMAHKFYSICSFSASRAIFNCILPADRSLYSISLWHMPRVSSLISRLHHLLCRKQQELQVARNSTCDWCKHAHTRTHTHVVFVL